MAEAVADPVVVGEVTTPYGLKGWVKIHSHTSPLTNLFDYQPLYLGDGQRPWRPLEFDQYRLHGKGMVAHVVGCDDRDQALLLSRQQIACSAGQLPEADEGEYYWRDLEGMRVVSRWQGAEQLLGEITGLLETGANDVMVVKPCVGSLDRRERLIPWLIDQFVLDVDTRARRVTVEWDPAF